MYIMSEETKNEIFERADETPKVKVELPESAPMETIAEEPVKTETVTETKPEPEPKKKKPKRILSEEHKAKLREQLKKGRETSLAKRRRKAQLKKIDKDEKSKSEDEKIFKALKNKLKPSELEDENKSLKKQLEDLKLQISKPKKERTVKTAATEDSDVDEAPAPVKPKAKPAKVLPPKPKALTARQKMKLMKGL